tara:strand:- start:240 stop:413 length:174 start_codon:yes stop_codon:yes gene_type:complete
MCLFAPQAQSAFRVVQPLLGKMCVKGFTQCIKTGIVMFNLALHIAPTQVVVICLNII